MSRKILFIALTENESIRGVERYSLELIRNLERYEELQITLLYGEWQTYFDTIDQKNITLKKIKIPNYKLSRHLYLIGRIPFLSRRFDMVHYANTLPVIFRNKTITVMTIHDLAEYFVPEKYTPLQALYRKKVLEFSLRNIDHIITVSFSSQKNIEEILKMPADKITCIYQGINHFKKLGKTDLPDEDKKLVSHPYFLYIGAIERSKGIEELVAAFEGFSIQYPEYKLYFIGKEANASPFLKSKVNNMILYLGYKNDAVLKHYLIHARGVANLSKFEGFGFPVLEAFIYNDNVISSNTTSLGEISKDFAWQVTPTDLTEIEECMKRVVAHPKKYDSAERERILAQYDWSSTARQYIALVNRVLN